MSFHSSSEPKFPSTNHLKEESLKEPSLLDITDTPTVYSHPKDASTCIKPNCSAKSNTHIPTRIHKASSQSKFDLLFATRNDPSLEEKKLLIPTRLPAPPRRQLTITEQPSTAGQLTPPSSPGGVQRRLRHAHIARLSRVQPSKEPTGKANQELAEFDPLISPIRSDNNKSIKDSLVTLVNSTAKSEQVGNTNNFSKKKNNNHNPFFLIRDHLNYRYEIIESLGKGSFGQVVKCRDMKPQSKDKNQVNNIVAVKIIRNKKRFHAQALTEIKILEKLMQLDPHNKYFIVRMLDNFYFRDHLCIVFECLSLNLYEVLQQNSYQGFSIGLVKRFAHQILSALKLLSDHKIIHCDLKPENILLKQPDKSGIKIIDFGSSCFVNERVYSYIQSRFYRAPEVILGLEYGLPIDMWSTGCILAELYTGRPLFPGENEPDQLACIMQLLGVPDKQYLDRCARKKQFFDMYDQPRKSINSKGKKRKPNSLTFTEALKRSSYDAYDREFVDFINKCLTWEPSERMTPEQALNHPWMKAAKK
ncbi:Putative CMGC/DYRK/DYRK2 protein kinase [Rhizopus microsporus]|nr:Putative CMGC/DYRK/DYRK2 protein kinase [Rhizopus microsporus]